MTASFLEQMLTIYIHLGMLSRGKEFHCMKIVMAVLDTAISI